MRYILLFLYSLYFICNANGFDSEFCEAAVQNGTFGFDGTTDRNGNLLQTTNLSMIEGYQYQYCVDNCGGGSDFNDYSTFSEQATIWFLPWFFLVAQIPYFTRDKLGDFVVMLLSIGSPTTALYSLFITIMDRKWLKSFCNAQLTKYGADETSRNTINDISEVLNSLHQFPIEVEEARFLVFTFPDRAWWKALRAWFVRTRRHMEASAYAQLLLTVVIYFLAVLPAAFADLGDATTAHGLAIGNLWMWLIPLVWGWFAVGAHHSRRQHVVDKLYNSARDLTVADNEKGDSIDNTPLKIRDTHAQHHFDGGDLSELKARYTILGFPIGGDELADGPFYNYARCWTWSELSCKTVQAYIDAERLRQMHRPDELSQFTVEMDRHDSQGFEAGYPLARGLQESDDTRGRRKDADMPATWPRKVKAFGLACVLHGIFGGSAFMIDYMTPTIGIGCRAFICMTYSIVSLSSCVFLMLASECSDSCSSQSKRCQSKIPFEGNRQSTEASPGYLLAVGAVLLRLLGKTLAILNAVFIVAGCILEFVGLYESCFCKSTYLGLRERAFVSFLSTDESVLIARPYWYGGAGAAISAVLIICFGYFRRLPRAK